MKINDRLTIRVYATAMMSCQKEKNGLNIIGYSNLTLSPGNIRSYRHDNKVGMQCYVEEVWKKRRKTY